MFHILNGESTAALLLSVELPGRKQPWGDLLMEGPLAPNPLDPDVTRKRGAYLEERFGITAQQYQQAMAASVDALHHARASGEVVLWTEEDLLCQTHSVFLIHALSQSQARISLAGPASGPIKGKAHELAAFFENRVAVTPERSQLATRVWRALTNADPSLLSRMTNAGDFTPWPALRDGLKAHLARFPSPRSGLGFVEEHALAAVAGGAATVGDVVRECQKAPGWTVYGIGDAQVGAYLRWMSRGNAPLVTLSGEPAWKSMPLWKFAITADGRAVLSGREDAVALRGADFWIGGVHVRGMSDVWRFDREKGALLKR